jgi:hypothetical protein
MIPNLLKSKPGCTLVEDLTGFIVAFAHQIFEDVAGFGQSRFCENLSGLSETKVTVTLLPTLRYESALQK